MVAAAVEVTPHAEEVEAFPSEALNALHQLEALVTMVHAEDFGVVIAQASMNDQHPAVHLLSYHCHSLYKCYNCCICNSFCCKHK